MQYAREHVSYELKIQFLFDLSQPLVSTPTLILLAHWKINMSPMTVLFLLVSPC